MEKSNYIKNVFLVHTGNSEYLEISLKRVKHTNPNVNIILLGDTENDKYNFIRHALIEDYNTYSRKFEKVYIHLIKENSYLWCWNIGKFYKQIKQEGKLYISHVIDNRI